MPAHRSPAPGARLLALVMAAGVAGGFWLAWQNPLARAPAWTEVTVGFAWPEYRASHSLRAAAGPEEQALLADLGRQAERAARTPGQVDGRFPYWQVRLRDRRGRETLLWLARDGRLFEPATASFWHAPELSQALQALGAELAAGFFAEPLPWPEVNPLFPVGGRARLADLESGLTLEVHRHRGDAHADVEPLTAADSRTLQQIFGGQWSWKRRAVVVEVAGRRIAASVNGMPHGWGDILDNDFPGHFCLHFRASRVHTSWRVDPGHQLMVLKAAGELAETMDRAAPAELVRLTLAAVNHHDRVAVRYAAGAEPPAQLWSGLTGTLRHLTVIGVREAEADPGRALVLADVTAYFHGPDRDRPYRKTVPVELVRPPQGGWRVVLESLAPLLDREGEPEAAQAGAPSC